MTGNKGKCRIAFVANLRGKNPLNLEPEKSGSERLFSLRISPSQLLFKKKHIKVSEILILLETLQVLASLVFLRSQDFTYFCYSLNIVTISEFPNAQLKSGFPAFQNLVF